MTKFKILGAFLLSNLGYMCNSFELITTFYPEQNNTRLAEYYFCLKQNLAHPLIEHINVFYEHMPANLPKIFQNSKIKLVQIDRRPSFNEMFVYANTELFGRKIIVVNTDIFF